MSEGTTRTSYGRTTMESRKDERQGDPFPSREFLGHGRREERQSRRESTVEPTLKKGPVGQISTVRRGREASKKKE